MRLMRYEAPKWRVEVIHTNTTFFQPLLKYSYSFFGLKCWLGGEGRREGGEVVGGGGEEDEAVGGGDGLCEG